MSYRNHRVVIASLFLPSTAVLGESAPSTPDLYARDPLSTTPGRPRLLGLPTEVPGTPPAVLQPYTPGHSRKTSLPAPMKSIVEDLKDKVCNSLFERITTLICVFSPE